MAFFFGGKIRPLLVGFKVQMRAPQTWKQVSRLLSPRMHLKTH
jgi:hypothetical protein